MEVACVSKWGVVGGDCEKEIASPVGAKKTFQCADVQVDDSVVCLGRIGLKVAPKWRVPAAALDIDDTEASVKFRSQTFKVVRYCVRRRMKDSDLQEGDGPALTTLQGRGLGSVGGDM